MDTGRLERSTTSYGSKPYMSPQGGGLRYSYFDPETRLDEIVLITHSVTLVSVAKATNAGRLPPPYPIPDRTLMIFNLMKTNQPPAPADWLPVPEQLGMYLVMRLASRSALTYFTSWYLGSVDLIACGTLALRAVLHEHQALRERHGCRCMSCEVEWLVRGWVCPWTRFVR